MDERAVLSMGAAAGASAATLVHPHYVLRVAGESAAKLASTWTGACDAAWHSLVDLRAQSAAQCESVCDELARIVPGVTDVADRRRVLDCRRSLHNGRPAKPSELDAVRRCVDSELFVRVSRLDNVHASCVAKMNEFKAIHDREMVEGAVSLGGLLESRNLQLALSYNNPRLLQRLKKHYRGDGKGVGSKTVRNLEDSLLQFFARASTKTSPLSSLTLMRVGQWRLAGGGSSTRLEGRVERRIESKAALMRHVLDAWLRDYDKATRVFPLMLNPTVVRSDGRLEMQRVSAGRDFIGRIWGTGIDIARFDANPMLVCVGSALEDSPAGALMAVDLVNRISTLAPKLPRDAIGTYVRKLYEIGYLIAKTDLLEQTDILEWMAQVVATAGEDEADPLVTALSRLSGNLEIMRGDDVERRIEASLDVDPSIFELATATGARIGGYLYRTPYYENCYYSSGDHLSIDVIERQREDFELIQQINRVVDANQLVHSSLCDYFVSRFGSDGVCADVQRFIEEFDQTYAPLVSEGKTDIDGVAPHSPRTLALIRARRAMEEYVERQVGQARDMQLDPQALRGILALLPPGMRARSMSYSYLVQPVKEGDFDGLVLNQVYGGRSGILSRFCEALDDAGMEQVRAYLRKSSQQGRNAELSGVFGFNANRHPAMSELELLVPPFGASYEATKKLSLADLRMKYIPEEHRLVFLDPDDVPVDVWYHGLLTPVMLPAVHRTLALAFSEGPCYLFPNALIRAMEAGQAEVLYSPRLTLGNVVVSRRSWTIANASCPDASMSAPDFYLAIREWQAVHGLPDRFFVRALLVGSGDRSLLSRYSAMKEINFKDLKPFYVDLRNPRFARLLQNMLKRHSLALFVSELLPDFDVHPTSVEGETRVAELHFELTSRASPSQIPRADWHALRIVYFGERKHLILGPVAEAVEVAKREFGVDRIFFLPHWKFGPHIDLVMHCDSDAYATRILPRIQSLIEDWIARNPSDTVLDPSEYEKTSRWIGTFEIDSGPYLPLLKNNTVSPVPYVRPKTLVVPEVAESKEAMLADCCELLLALYRLKDEDSDAFFMTLHAMLVSTAETPRGGAKEGYMSMRSHADYFFAAHDTENALRQRFDAIDEKNRDKLDRITRASAAGKFDECGLPASFVAIVVQWRQVLAGVDDRSKHIVSLRYDEVAGQNDQFIEMATRMRQDVPDEYFERYRKRQISEVGAAFINTKAGQDALKRPEFLAYRINVNFFYALLPLLEIAPIQKFLLCHLMANSVERVHEMNWRDKVERIHAIERAGQ
jgi:hypothetical protein